jgi:hypothetical protein
VSAQAVIVSRFSLLTMCWISKPANVNGSICRKRHLADDVLRKNISSIIFYEDGLQTQHGKCGRINNRDGIVLYVQRTVIRIPGRGYMESEPKTKSSRRRIELPAVAIEVLKEHCINQGKARIKAGEKWNERDIVFTNKYGGFLRPDTVLDTFHQLLKDAGLPTMQFQDLIDGPFPILGWPLTSA